MQILRIALVAWLVLAPEVLRYPLPDALVNADGSRVKDAAEWREKRRPEILKLFADEVYGNAPPAARAVPVRFHVDSVDAHALSGLAIRKQITVFLSGKDDGPRMHVLLYLPAKRHGRVAVFLGLNFFGNQTVDADPGIDLPEVWAKDDSTLTYGGELAKHHKERALESSRGLSASLWQVEKILSHGFGLATASCGDIEPDFLGGMAFGIRQTFLQPGQTAPADNEWGALAAWAWGLSRMADYLETDGGVDKTKLIVNGFSRLGKAAMWSAAQDRRYAMVISSESGVGGLSLYRAATAETIEHLNTAFPYWFCGNFHKYTGHPERVPVDGNLLSALMAPRPLYVASAELDRSSDPPAEFLSAFEAGKVYELLGRTGLRDAAMPGLDKPVIDGVVGYHVRSGKHNVTAFDWDAYLAFAEGIFKR